MDKKKVYIIRHGETDFNKKNIVQGSGVDSDLNDTGRAQAHSFFKSYREVPFDKIYISQLKRTRQTVQHFIDAGIPVEELQGLNEISWGVHEGLEHNKEFDNEYWKRVKEWREGHLHIRITGGESPLELAARQEPAIEYIFSQTQEKTILICMHGRALKSFLCLIQNMGLQHMDDHDHSNTGLYLFEYDSEKFNLLKTNDRSHLDGLGVLEDLT